MAHNSNQSQLSEDDKNLLAAAAVVGMGLVAVALFPNPITTPVVIGKCGYHLRRIMGGMR
jgi:Na+(H+)/acetate symporter ActP